MIRQRFERTVCGCEQCRDLCRAIPGMLVPGDAEAIREHLGVTEAELCGGLLAASPGAVVAKSTERGYEIDRVRTVVPAKRDGACVFYQDGKCAVHPVAPFGCSHFDPHMSGPEGDVRSHAALRDIMDSESYLCLWMQLWASGHRTDGPETKRKDAERVIAERIADLGRQASEVCGL